jgi:hypothetical protein
MTQNSEATKAEIKDIIAEYSMAISSLGAATTVQLLRHNKIAKRRKLLKKIWKGESCHGKEPDVFSGRTPETGMWIFDRLEFKTWLEDPSLLVCHGMRIHPLTIELTLA